MFFKAIHLFIIISCSGYSANFRIKGSKPFICKSSPDDKTRHDETQDSANSILTRSFLLNGNRHWPYGIVPYEIDPTFSEYQVRWIKAAVKKFRDHSCVTWVPHTEQRDYVYFAKFPKSGVCNSPIGRKGFRQLINLNDDCFEINKGFKGAVLHEMMHAIGFVHEQQRLDRDCYVNVAAAYKINSDFAMVANTSTQFPYDFGSIMHYGTSQLMKSRSGVQELGNFDGTFTQIDIMKLNYMYCGGKTFCELYPGSCVALVEAQRRCVISKRRDKYAKHYLR